MKTIIGVLTFFLLISIACSSSTPASSPPPGQVQKTNPPPTIQAAASTPVPTNTIAPTETSLPGPTPEPIAQLQQLISKALGTSNRNVQRLSSITYDPGTSEIAVTFAANDNFSKDLINLGIKMDIVDILKTIQQSNTPLPYTSIFVVATFSLVDVYGNASEANVVLATYDRANLDKVNWDSFLTDNTYLIANQDTLYIHPALQP